MYNGNIIYLYTGIYGGYKVKVVIEAGSLSWNAEIYDTRTGQLIKEALSSKEIKGRANRWGQEIYFSIPISANLEPGASDIVSKGDLAYWPPGNAFCIFWGPTPASQGEEIRAASPVNVFGSIKGDLDDLNQVNNGDEIIVRQEK